MVDQLQIALTLTARDLMSPEIRAAYTTLQSLRGAVQTTNAEVAKPLQGESTIGRLGEDALLAAERVGGLGTSFSAMALAMGEGMIAAEVVSKLVEGISELATEGFRANEVFERQAVTLEAFTKSASLAQGMVAALQETAAEAGKSGADVIQMGVQLAPAARTLDDMNRATRAALELAAINPMIDQFSAARAVERAIGGDYTLLTRSGNVPTQMLKDLKSQGLEGLDLVDAALKRMGGDWELVTKQGDTFSGQIVKLGYHFEELEKTASKGMFNQFEGSLKDVNTQLEESDSDFQRVASTIGAAFGVAAQVAIDVAKSKIHEVAWEIGAVQSALDLLKSAAPAQPSDAEMAATARPGSLQRAYALGNLRQAAFGQVNTNMFDPTHAGGSLTFEQGLARALDQIVAVEHRSGFRQAEQRSMTLYGATVNDPFSVSAQQLATSHAAMKEAEDASLKALDRFNGLKLASEQADQALAKVDARLSEIGKQQSVWGQAYGAVSGLADLYRKAGIRIPPEVLAAMNTTQRQEFGAIRDAGWEVIRKEIPALLSQQVAKANLNAQHVDVHTDSLTVNGGLPGSTTPSSSEPFTSPVAGGKYDYSRMPWTGDPRQGIPSGFRP